MERLGCDFTHDFVRVVDIQGVYDGRQFTQFIMEQRFLVSKLMTTLL